MASIAEDFDQFWARYPRRTGKLAALRAYEKARRLDSAEHILAGVERYRRTMPDDPQYRPHPATWLNAGRWLDEDDEPVARPVRVECPHEPRCNSKVWCAALRDKEARMLSERETA
jgi:hypothetical protein